MFDPILRIDRIYYGEDDIYMGHEQLPNQSLFDIVHLADVNLSPASCFAESNAIENMLSFTIYEKELTEYLQSHTIPINGEDVPLSDIVSVKKLLGSNTSHTWETPVLIAPVGDITLDTKIDSMDAQRVLSIYCDLVIGVKPENIIYNEQYPDLAKLAADVDQNGKIDLYDAQYILIYYAYQLAGEADIKWEDIIAEKL